SLSYRYCHHPPPSLHLPSSPTRRSSDLSSPMRFSLSGSSMSAACCWHTLTVENSYRCYFCKQSSYPQAVLFRRWSSFWLRWSPRSEEHTSELQSRVDFVCRLLLVQKD